MLSHESHPAAQPSKRQIAPRRPPTERSEPVNHSPSIKTHDHPDDPGRTRNQPDEIAIPLYRSRRIPKLPGGFEPDDYLTTPSEKYGRFCSNLATGRE